MFADRAYDSDAQRRMPTDCGATSVIPNKVNPVNRNRFDAMAYKIRTTVERAFCRIKGFRPVATVWQDCQELAR